MSEETKDVLRISLDDLQSVATPQIVAPTPATQTSGKSYGSIYEPAEPQTLAQEKANFFLKAWVYLGLAGFVGAMLGWSIAEPAFVDGPGSRWGNTWLIPLIVTLMCVGFAVAESIVERSFRKAAIRIGIALPLGVALSFVFDFIANIIYNIGLGVCAQAGVQTFHNPAVWIARALAWAVFGVAGGVVYGIIGRSGKKTGYGALGGAIGAALGGLIFDPIAFATHGGAASRAVGFGLLGMATGISMGLVESALKDRWLYVTAGPLAGKQFILYKPQTSMGSIQTCDIYLFKDAEILPQHATLLQKGDRMHLIAQGTVYLAGQRIHSSRVLESGSILQVGRYAFRYQERLRS
ncbi:FHA domain-containing protein [Edaphobacter aggregans]|uniref:FHA domain-containing protein n=1 Tax=Edaphobacter aggregans TaxID=570835 RepID=UPI0005526358|nr:FHA domain-containing protein [Edaphobacter aggregans]